MATDHAGQDRERDNSSRTIPLGHLHFHKTELNDFGEPDVGIMAPVLLVRLSRR